MNRSNYELQKGALGAWREIAGTIEELTGSAMTIVQAGTLLVGWDASDRRQIEQFTAVAREFDAPMRAVSRRDSPEIFEGISHRIGEGVLMQDDAWINPDEVIKLLFASLDALECSNHRRERPDGVLER